MTTVSQVISRALKEITVISASEAAEASESQDTLDALNAMLFAWELDGITLNHVELVVGDTLPYPPNHEDPIVYNLAVRIVDQFEGVLKPTTARKAEIGYRNLQNYYVEPGTLKVDPAITPQFAPNRYFHR